MRTNDEIARVPLVAFAHMHARYRRMMRYLAVCAAISSLALIVTVLFVLAA